MRALFLIICLGLTACGNEENNSQEIQPSNDINSVYVNTSDDGDSSEKELMGFVHSCGFSLDKEASKKSFDDNWTNSHFWISLDNYEFEQELETPNLNVIYFAGVDRHEGGYSFNAALINDTTMLVLNSMNPSLERGNSIHLSIEDSIPCLLIKTKDEKLKDVFVKSDIPLANDIDVRAQQKLAGTFKDRNTGDTLEFIASTKSVQFGSESFHFSFELDEYDQLVDVITFNERSFLFERNGDVLKLTVAKLEEEEDFISWVSNGDANYFDLIEEIKEMTYKKFVDKLSSKE